MRKHVCNKWWQNEVGECGEIEENPFKVNAEVKYIKSLNHEF